VLAIKNSPVLSHKQLDIAERRVAIEQIHPFQTDLQSVVLAHQGVGIPTHIDILVVATRFRVVEGATHGVFAFLLVHAFHSGLLEQMMAAALGLLGESATACQTLHTDTQQELVLVHQGRMQTGVLLIVHQRHPVVAILGEQVEPLLVALFIQQAGFRIHKIYKGLTADFAHGYSSSFLACCSGSMNFTQARNWARICISLVPLITTFFCWSSSFSTRRARFIQSRPRDCKPCWARSYISRSS